jgi:hypothetical protein
MCCLRVVFYLLLGLLVVSSSLGFAVAGEVRYSRVFLFDSDGDGVLEVVSDIGFVSGGALAPFSRVFDVYRFYCDSGLWCLMLFDRGFGISRVYVPGRLLSEFYVDGGISVSNHPYNMLSVGSKAYWGGLWFKASLNATDLKAFLYDGRVTLAYIDRVLGYVVVESPGRLPPIRVTAFNGSIAGVGVLGESILLLLSSPTGSALVEWSPGGVFRVKVYNVTLGDAIAFTDGVFIANGGGGVYIVSFDRIALLLGGYKAVKVGLGGEILVVGSDRVIVALAHPSGLRVLRELPVTGVVDLDYGGDMLAYTDGLSVSTIRYRLESPVELSIPPNAIAGEPVVVSIAGDFRVAYVSLPGLGVVKLTPESPRYTWRPPVPGVYTVTALVETGGSQVTLSKTVAVAPRPVVLSIRVDSPAVRPYSSVNIVLELRDGRTGASLRDVLGECSVTVSGRTYPARPWVPVTVPAIPVGLEVPVTARCTLPQPYSEAGASTTLRVNETYVRVEALYLGAGVLRFHAYNMYTGEPVDGELRVTVGENTTIVRVGGEVRLPKPGLWEVRWELVSGGVVLSSGVSRVAYYERLDVAPLTTALAVADRLITVTTTKIEVERVPQTMPVEVTRVDPVVALLSFIAGLALAGVPLVVILIRRVGGGE